MATQGKHNLVGEVFDDFVISQIDTRQKIYGKTERSIQDQQFLNNNGAFVRLVSSVDLDGADTSGFGEFNGSTLAKDFILQGGAIIKGDLPYGVTGISGNPAYGLGTSGGNPYGYSPLPHLTDVDVKSLNRGSLREANLNIIAYNPIQLNIIDALYLRLGYTVLLEWGHNILPDGSTNTYSLKDKILGGGYEGNAIRKVLDETRNLRKLSKGNYDAFFGKIKNYSWSFENDGSYKISLSIVSMGDVVESISVGSRYGKLGIEPLNLTEGQKQGIREAADKVKREENIKKSEEGEAVESDSEENANQLIFAESAQSDLNEYLYRCITYDVNADTSNENYYVVALGLDVENIQGGESTAVDLTNRVPGPKAANGGVNIIGIPFDGCANQDQYFIRLGWLLEFIEKNVLIYQTEGGDRNAPLINIAYDADQNFCLTHKMQISADPRVCVIGSKNVEGLGELHPKLDSYYSTSPVECGKLMNIYISFVQIVSLLKEKRDDKGNVPLLDFLQGLMDKVATAMGGINTFEVIVDEDTNTLKILDNAKIPGIEKALEKQSSPAVFEIYGYTPGNSSFIKSISLKTEITNNLATEITVGAQAGGVVDGAVDASAPSLLNKGFKDRIVPVKVAPGGNKKTTGDAQAEAAKKFEEDKKIYDAFVQSQLTAAKKGSGILTALYNFFADDDANWDPELFDSCVSIQNNILKSDFIAAAKSDKASPLAGFIPLNLGLTFIGLSGMKIFEKFKINQSFLPSNYSKNIDFVLKGISHKIDKDGWFTSIESLSIPNNDKLISGVASNPGLKTTKSTTIAAPPKPPAKVPPGESSVANADGGGEFPNNAPSANAYAGGGGSYNANNKSLTAAEQKNIFSQKASITNNIPYTPGFKGKLKIRPKDVVKRIFLHHTAGGDSRRGVINTFDGRGFMCEFIVGRNYTDQSGAKWNTLIEQAFDYRYFRGVCNSSNEMDKEIGIEICSYGGGYKFVAGPKGECKEKRCLWMDGYGPKAADQHFINESDTELCVDINLKPKKYCGVYSHAQAIKPDMIKELEALLDSLMTRYNIPFTFETEQDFERLFPFNSGPYGGKKNGNKIKSVTGICTHRMTHTGGKADVMPTANIVAMLKRLGNKFKNGAPSGGNNANPAAKISVPAQFANANVGFRQGVAKSANQVPQVITADFAVVLLKKYLDDSKIEINKNIQLRVEDPLGSDYQKGTPKDQLVYKKGAIIEVDTGRGDYTNYIRKMPNGRIMFPLDVSFSINSIIVSIDPKDIAAITKK